MATKQTQGKGKSAAADDAKDNKDTSSQDEAPTTAVDQGYAVSPDPEAVASTSPGGAAETGGDAANARQPVKASPLEEEQQNYDRRPPVEPQRHLSTSPVAAAAGQRSLVGQGTLGLVDEDGNDLDPGDVFDDGDGTATYVTTKKRVYERFVQRGARTPVTRLLFPANARVPRDKADLFVHAVKAEAANALTEAAGRERLGEDGEGDIRRQARREADEKREQGKGDESPTQQESRVARENAPKS